MNNGSQSLSKKQRAKAVEFINQQCKLANEATQRQDWATAIKLYRQAAKIATKSIPILLALAQVHLKAGEPDNAKKVYKESLKIEDNAASRLGLAIVLVMKKELSQAVKQAEAACMLDPGLADAHYYLGACLFDLGQFSMAVEPLKQAIKLKPTFLRAYVVAGQALVNIGKIEAAIHHFRQALELQPDNTECHARLGTELFKVGDFKTAKIHLDRSLELQPDNNGIAIIGIGNYLERMGQPKKVLQFLANQPLLLRESIAAQVLSARALHDLGHYDEALEIALKYLDYPDIDLLNRRVFHTVAHKIYNQTGRYNSAFRHAQIANDLSENPGANHDEHLKFVTGLLDAFEPHTLKRISLLSVKSSGHQTKKKLPKPVFIVGMPRSGTTLVEQLLCRHSRIGSIGEQRFLGDTVENIPQLLNLKGSFTDLLDKVTPEILLSVRQSYLQQLQTASNKPQAKIVIDKMMMNYLYLPIITALFPEAVIIHCQRNPLDNCLSCYFTSFNNGHGYSNNLQTLGKRYRLYQELMVIWEVRINHPIFELRYEKLVDSPQQVLSTLIQSLGLKWEDSLLNFKYNNTEFVSTASYRQVRKPMYHSSINRHQHYQAHLKPLIEGLSNEPELAKY